MRAEDAAKRIGVSRRTIYRWIKRGWLTTTTVWEQTANSGGYWRTDISIDALVEADDIRTDLSILRSREAKRRCAS